MKVINYLIKINETTKIRLIGWKQEPEGKFKFYVINHETKLIIK